MLGVKSVPMEFGVNGKRRWLRINDLLQLQIEGTAGADANQESLVVNPAFGLVPWFPLWWHFQTNMPITIMECNGIVLAKMGSIAGLATHLKLLILISYDEGLPINK